MNINIDKLGPCKYKVSVALDSQEVKEAMITAAKEISPHVSIPGFRKGKAPVELIIKNFENTVLESAEDNTREKIYEELKTKHNLIVEYTVNYEALKVSKDGIEYVEVVECEPEFQMPQYKGLPVKREVREITNDDVDSAINRLRKRYADYVSVDEPAAVGDIVVVSYKGTYEGKSLKEVDPGLESLSENKDFWVRVGGNSFIPGFGDQLVGIKKGETRVIKVELPNNFEFPAIAGKTVQFEVTAEDIKKEVLPELNDDFAKKLGAKSLEELRKGVEADLKRDLNYRIKESIRSQVVEELLSRIEFEMPETAVANETRRIVYRFVKDQQEMGTPKEEIEKRKDEIFAYATREARKRLKLYYLAKKLVEQEGLLPDTKDIISYVNELAISNGQKPEDLLEQIKKNNAMPEIYRMVILNKAIDLLVDYAKIEDVLPQSPGK